MQRNRWGAVGASALLASVVAAACAPGVPAVVTPLEPCRPPQTSCAMPFPSLRFQVADPSTVTGVSVKVPDGALPQDALDRLGPGGRISDVYALADGFSPLTPVLFEVGSGIDDSSVPRTGGDAVQAFDLDTSEAIAVRAEVVHLGQVATQSSRVLAVWPRTSFPAGHRVAVGVTDALTDARGRETRPLAPGDLTAVGPALGELVQRSGNSYLLTSVASFTVRSRVAMDALVDPLIAATRAADHPVRNLVVSPSLFGGAAQVTGQIQISDFRNSQGYIPSDGTAASTSNWIDFLLTLPAKGTTAAGAPVIVYAHGLTINKETQLLNATTNARHGFATLSIDAAYHGSRSLKEKYLLELTNPRDFGKLTGLTLQTGLDHVSLVQALKGALADLDVVPLGNGRNGDGVIDLDTSHILCEGTSMGSFNGTLFAEFVPEVEGCFQQVGGAGIMDTLAHSRLWFLFDNVVPTGVGPADYAVLVASAQQALDRGDSANYLNRLSDRKMPYFLQTGVRDGIVPQTSSERLVAGLDLSLVGPLRSPLAVPHRDGGDAFGGSGFAQTVPAMDGVMSDFGGHISFAVPEAVKLLDEWVAGRAAAIRAEAAGS